MESFHMGKSVTILQSGVPVGSSRTGLCSVGKTPIILQNEIFFSQLKPFSLSDVETEQRMPIGVSADFAADTTVVVVVVVGAAVVVKVVLGALVVVVVVKVGHEWPVGQSTARRRRYFIKRSSHLVIPGNPCRANISRSRLGSNQFQVN
jgi:hypothetical protein